MFTISGSTILLTLIVFVILAIAAWILARGAGDRSANRLQELIEYIERTPDMRRVTKVRRKQGVYHLDISGEAFDGDCTYSPSWLLTSEVCYSNKDGLEVTHPIRSGRQQEDVDTFFASLNIPHSRPPLAETVAQLDYDRDLELDPGSSTPDTEVTSLPQPEASQGDTTVYPRT